MNNKTSESLTVKPGTKQIDTNREALSDLNLPEKKSPGHVWQYR